MILVGYIVALLVPLDARSFREGGVAGCVSEFLTPSPCPQPAAVSVLSVPLLGLVRLTFECGRSLRCSVLPTVLGWFVAGVLGHFTLFLHFVLF